MVKISKILILGLVIGGILSFGLPKIFQSSAQEMPKKMAIKEKKLVRRVDKDKNKIFDDLEELLVGQPDEAKFDSIVVFEEPLSDILFENLKGEIGDFALKYQYPSISAIATTLNKKQIRVLSKIPGVKQIEHDAKVIPFLDKATLWFGVQKARTDFGLDGNLDGLATYSKDDIVIAVIDSGIDPNHVDLDGGKIIGWKDYATGQANPYDECGHGTHVSSIAAGEGQGDSLYKGVAPGAALVGVKVLKVVGNKCTGTVSDVNAGVQWVIDNKATYGIEIFNMSIGIAGSSDGTDSTSLIVNSAVDAGLVGIVAAGNEGPEKYTIGSPAAAAKAITVGAMADVQPRTTAASFDCGNAPAYGFYQACFSSRGPTADNRIKPDISAPGVFIKAAAMETTNGYIEYSGTSMSSPFIAGLVGLMLQASPTLTPLQVKTKITETAKDWGSTGADIDYGAGRLDGYKTIQNAGGYSGTNITTPKHQYFTGSLTGTADVDWFDINVTDGSYPIAITFITPAWTGIYAGVNLVGASPDFDIFLYASDETTLLASSEGILRQETIGYQPTTTGIYKLKVYSFSGSGDYFFDLSAGITPPTVAIHLTTDGTTPFGSRALDSTIDTTASGTNDIQTVEVDAGPADLDIKTTLFSNNGNSWSLGITNGDNRVVWEYSKNGTNWTIFKNANTLHWLSSNLPQSGTRNLYLRLTMPTQTSSSALYSSIVTIVATSP